MKTAVYCDRCSSYLREEGEGERDYIDPIRWIPACGRCAERDREERAQVARLEELWRVRSCAADGCEVVFAPSMPKQRFCSDPCRARAWRERQRVAA